ncbi:MAG: hypothetical protein IEMM0002_1304 [bacterium]|nr:MAG: hypothetical protein IEMM0002_1304 [bacterium]
MYKHYKTLNLQPGADLGRIKKAFRALVQRYHPDANGGVGNPDKFKEVVKAYHYLQQNYKTLGIKPQQPRKPKRPEAVSIWNVFVKNVKKLKKIIRPSIPNFVNFVIKIKKPAGVPGNKRAYDDIGIDPIVLQLPFDELKLRLKESSNDYVKKQAARALADLFGVRALAPFVNELRVASPRVCEEIIFCMGLIGSGESVRIIGKFTKHPNVRVACAAVNALRYIDNGYAKRVLANMEREGRAIGAAFVQFFDTLRSGRIIRIGAVDRSEFYIARALRKNRREPLWIILRELGWVF